MSKEPQQQKEQAPGQHNPTQDRNDPAIDPRTPDDQGQPSTPGQSQSQSQSQQQSRSSGPQDGENSAYVPDYEPQQKPKTQRNLQPTQGHDADIDTPGG
ncbi:hypothetical protein EGJ27_11145 [Pseudomonas sp. v388]|uniref:hypothetical protein n=1 Tax=Pseudomonas sp. v388 TaxID=2479849 RepID=UPI000F79134C|nr:hypothetical protein [Pseudomonas sp. v388]RRV07238.1 hypothetical protein EGJ27_11145 [Pseudomonas sp. v388]